MTTYYFSSAKGSDSNSGTSADKPFSSLSMLDGIKLKGGDTILLERGSSFDDTINLKQVNGSANAPLTISAYGQGEAPVIEGTKGSAIQALKADYVVVENITIGETGNAGIKTNGSDYWVIRNVTFDESGGKTVNGSGINWYNGGHVLLENNTFKNTYGDNVFMRDVNDIVVKDNIFEGVHGGRSDNLQIQGDNAIVTGNLMITGLDPKVGKGNMVFEGNGLFASDNYITGGGFGLGVSGSDIVITDNIVTGHTKYNWSYGIGVAAEGEIKISENILISDNHLSDNTFGINVVGATEYGNRKTPLDVDNITIKDNTVHDWKTGAVKFSNVNILEGNFEDNVFGEKFTAPVSNKYSKTDLSGLHMDNNLYAGDILVPVPVPQAKLVSIQASADMFNGAPIMQIFKNGLLVHTEEVTALKSAGQKETISFKLSDFDADDKLSIKFINNLQDKLTGGDRNLYVHSISVDGVAVKLSDADRGGNVGIGKGGSSLNFTKTSEVFFDAKDLHLDQEIAKAVQSKPLVSKPLELADVLDQSEYLSLHHGDLGVVSNTANAGLSTGATFASLNAALDNLHLVMTDNFA